MMNRTALYRIIDKYVGCFDGEPVDELLSFVEIFIVISISISTSVFGDKQSTTVPSTCRPQSRLKFALEFSNFPSFFISGKADSLPMS
jgi:hypothetical protein